MTAAPRPRPAATLDEVADTIAAGTSIAGLGESTRFAHETFDVRDQLFRRLAGRHGFRALAVQDDAVAGAALDAYVTGGEGSAASALDGAWRTAEMAAALTWIRAFNRDRDDPIRIFGVKPAQPRPADYDAVLDHTRRVAPQHLAELGSHLTPIRTAHQTDEHVQRARGVHPGHLLPRGRGAQSGAPKTARVISPAALIISLWSMGTNPMMASVAAPQKPW